MGVDDVFGEDPISAPVENEPAPQPEVETEAPEAEQPPEPQPEPEPAQPEPESRHVPINALLDERDKRKELERRLAEAEARNQPQAQPEPIDPYDDPQGFANQLRREVEAANADTRFKISDRFARLSHGDEVVQSAIDWAAKRAPGDQAFAAQYFGQEDPIGWIVQQHKRDALLSDIGDDPDDWFAREAAKRGYVTQGATAPAFADAAPKQASPPAKVPRSLAAQGSAPSDIRHTATGPLAGVDAVFN